MKRPKSGYLGETVPVGGGGGGGGGIRSERHVKRGEKIDPVRHDKETDRYGRTDVSGDHEYLFCL